MARPTGGTTRVERAGNAVGRSGQRTANGIVRLAQQRRVGSMRLTSTPIAKSRMVRCLNFKKTSCPCFKCTNPYNNNNTTTFANKLANKFSDYSWLVIIDRWTESKSGFSLKGTRL